MQGLLKLLIISRWQQQSTGPGVEPFQRRSLVQQPIYICHGTTKLPLGIRDTDFQVNFVKSVNQKVSLFMDVMKIHGFA